MNTIRGVPFLNKLRGQTPSVGLIQSISPIDKIPSLSWLCLLGGIRSLGKKTARFFGGTVQANPATVLGDDAPLPGVLDQVRLGVQAEFA